MSAEGEVLTMEVLARKFAPVEVSIDSAEAVPCLYIILRSDLASMTPGKAAAQAAHAANQLTSKWDHKTHGIDWWLLEGDGFGTVITLEGDEQDCITTAERFKGEMIPHGIIEDPSYPIPDGAVVHKIPLVTCAYVFVKDKNNLKNPTMEYLQTFGLYEGSRYPRQL
jgi:peptidyl-tRNA hydrolase